MRDFSFWSSCGTAKQGATEGVGRRAFLALERNQNAWLMGPGELQLFKLYKRETDNRLMYHEAWPAGPHVVEHWGVCGDRGETSDHPVASDADAELTLERLKKAAEAKGYKPIPEEGMVFLVVEYPIDGNPSSANLERRFALEDAFNELVGWLGLGDLDGGSMGSGTMEVALRVVDFDIAKTALESHTAGTDLAGFRRICRQ